MYESNRVAIVSELDAIKAKILVELKDPHPIPGEAGCWIATTSLSDWITRENRLPKTETKKANIGEVIVKKGEEALHKLGEQNVEMEEVAEMASASRVENSSLLCVHGKLSPRMRKNMKRITKRLWDTVIEDCRGGPILGDEDMCPECCLEISKEETREALWMKNGLKHLNYLLEHGVLLKNLEEGDFKKGKLLCGQWLRRWARIVHKKVPTKKKKAEETSLSPEERLAQSLKANFVPEENVNELLLCEHGGLKPKLSPKAAVVIPEESWKQLMTFYPESRELAWDEEPCALCQVENLQEQQQTSVDSKTVAKERLALSDLMYSIRCITHGTVPAHDFLTHLGSVHDAFVIVPSEWLLSWYTYVNDPKLSPAPGHIATGSVQLLCPEHEKFLYDINALNELRNMEIYPVSEQEWATLCELYGMEVGYPIVRVTREQSAKRRRRTTASSFSPADSRFLTQPVLCEECVDIGRAQWESMQSCYTQEKIYIVRMSRIPGSTTSSGRTTRRATSGLPLTNSSGKQQVAAVLTVDSSSTIRSVKKQIADKLGV